LPNGNGLLTPPVISKLPLGLLQFLGIQSGGTYPHTLGTTLTPTWDQLELFAGAHGEHVFDTNVAVTALNNSPSTIVIPQNEMWYVSQIRAFLSTGVGETLTGYASAFAPAGIPTYPTVLLSSTLTLLASEQRHAQSHRIPAFFPPGVTFGFTIDAATGLPLAANAAQIGLYILRFRF
jgi:hypothetical protein